MDIRSRLIAPAGKYFFDEQRVELDAAEVIRRILLFDTYIINSSRLLEIPEFVNLFGLTGLKTLLNSGCLKIRCEAISMGYMGETTLGPNADKGIFPLKDILLIQMANRKQYVSSCLQNVHKSRINLKEAIKLKNCIIDAFIESPPDLGAASLDSAREDLNNDRLLTAVVAQSLVDIAKVTVPSDIIKVKAHQIDSKRFEIESNIASLGGVGEFLAQKTLDHTFSALGTLNLRIEEMRAFSAVSGFTDQDITSFVDKLDFLGGAISESKGKEQAFSRVVEIAGVPDGPIDGIIDVDKLLRIRESRECVELREWLNNVSNLSDVDIKSVVASFKAKASTLFNSGPGTLIRLLVTTGTGLLPDLGLVGAGLAGLDYFIVNKLLPDSGPAAFINRLYPSIFPEQINSERI